jgi:hypothetical protein
VFGIEAGRGIVIQMLQREPYIMRYEVTDYEWAAVRPLLPNNPRGVPRGDDRPILNGIFWVLRSCQILLADEK